MSNEALYLRQIKANYAIYLERARQIAHASGYLEEGAVPAELRVSGKGMARTGGSYSTVDVVARMLSVYDGAKDCYRSEADYTATMLTLLLIKDEDV